MNNSGERVSSNPEHLFAAHCEIVDLTTPEELYEAWELDTAIFSENRPAVAGPDVGQPLIEHTDYLRAATKGHILGLRTAGHPDFPDGTLVGAAGIMMEADPESDEPILRHLNSGEEKDDAYLWVSFLKKEFRGRKLGGVLLDARMEKARAAGKRRILTVVHPTNLRSQGNLNSREFMAVGIQAAYDMDSREGIRFIMLNGDIHNPNWAEESSDEMPISTIEIYEAYITNPYASVEEADAVEEDTGRDNLRVVNFDILAVLLQSGLCIRKANRLPSDPRIIQYHLASTKDLPLDLLPLRIYPYPNLLQGYQAESPPAESSQLWTLFTHIILSQMDNLYATKTHPHIRRAETVWRALYSRSFIDWITAYHKNLQNNVPADDVLPPDRGELSDVGWFRVGFLRAERAVLLRLASGLPSWHPILARVTASSFAPDSSAYTSQQLAIENVQLYKIFADYPLEKLHYDLHFRSKIDSRIAFALGKVISKLGALFHTKDRPADD